MAVAESRGADATLNDVVDMLGSLRPKCAGLGNKSRKSHLSVRIVCASFSSGSGGWREWRAVGMGNIQVGSRAPFLFYVLIRLPGAWLIGVIGTVFGISSLLYGGMRS